MAKLGQKDWQILYQLDLNARQSNAKIAKIVGLSKDSIGYRIKQLEKKNFIQGYNTVINANRLGYTHYRIFLNLLDMTSAKYEELIKFLQEKKNVWWIAKCDGAWDFAFSMWVKTNKEFRDFYNNEFLIKFRPNIKEHLVSPLIRYKHFSKTYLLENKKPKKIEFIGTDDVKDYDETDFKILNILAKNARIQLLKIAQQLNLDSMTIHHRIKKMEQKGIIEGYKVDLNFSLLKRLFYVLKINVNDMSQVKKIESFMKTIPELTNITEAIGSYDFECDLEVDSTAKYFEIIKQLEDKFDFIREIIYFRVLKNYKILYMPEI